MPTAKERIEVLFTMAERRGLERLLGLTQSLRRGHPLKAPRRQHLPEWLRDMILARAEEIRAQLRREGIKGEGEQ